MLFKAEIIRAKPSQPRLHLICNTNTASGTDMLIHSRQIPLRRNDLPAHAWKGLGNKPRQFTPLGLDALNRLVHLRRVFLSALRIVTAIAPAVVVGHINKLNPVGLSHAPLGVKLVGRDINRASGIAVIAVIGCDHIAPTSRRTRKAKSQFIGLGARVDKITNIEPFGHLLSDLLSKSHLSRVQIACV